MYFTAEVGIANGLSDTTEDGCYLAGALAFIFISKNFQLFLNSIHPTGHRRQPRLPLEYRTVVRIFLSIKCCLNVINFEWLTGENDFRAGLS